MWVCLKIILQKSISRAKLRNIWVTIAYLFNSEKKIFSCKIQAPNKFVTYVVVFVCKQGNLIFVFAPPPPNLGENSLQLRINVDIYFSYFGSVQKPSQSSAPHIFQLRNSQLINEIITKLKCALHTKSVAMMGNREMAYTILTLFALVRTTLRNGFTSSSSYHPLLFATVTGPYILYC